MNILLVFYTTYLEASVYEGVGHKILRGGNANLSKPTWKVFSAHFSNKMSVSSRKPVL